MNVKPLNLLLVICCVTTLCVMMFYYPKIVRLTQVKTTHLRTSEMQIHKVLTVSSKRQLPNASQGVIPIDDSLKSKNQNNWQDLNECQNIRLDRLRSHCNNSKSPQDMKDIPVKLLKKLVFKFLVDDIHKVVLRSIPKTGCSSWKSLLIMNSPNYNPSIVDLEPHSWEGMYKNYSLKDMMTLSKAEILSRLKSYFFILTVRHPLARLESAFMDKIVINGKHRFTRKRDPEIFDKELIFVYFHQFLETLMTDHQQGNYINGHWRAIVKHARPCLFPFSFIAKTETMSEEMEYISQTKLSGVKRALHENQSRNTSFENHRSDGGELLPLFSGLKNPAAIIEKLKEWYGQDMKLFGYGFKIESGHVIAVCDNFETYGKCC